MRQPLNLEECIDINTFLNCLSMAKQTKKKIKKIKEKVHKRWQMR